MQRVLVIATLALATSLSPVSAQDLVGVRIDGPGEVVENTITRSGSIVVPVFLEFQRAHSREIASLSWMSSTTGAHSRAERGDEGRGNAECRMMDHSESVNCR